VNLIIAVATARLGVAEIIVQITPDGEFGEAGVAAFVPG